MATDYSLQFPCEVRKAIPEAKLFYLVKQRALAQFAAAKLREAHPEADTETIFNKWTVVSTVTGPDGTAKQVPVTIAQLLSETAPLDNMSGHCQKCRANVAARPFGCIGKINYPITSVSEGWLTSRLPDDAENPGLKLLLKFLEDLEVDGAGVAQFRARPAMFESKVPKIRSWGSWPSQRQLSSSQLLQILVFGGNVVAQQAQLYTKLLGLDTVLTEQHPRSDQIEQFKTLFCAIVMAGRLNCGIYVEA
jgi:hypothetical protein